jgi:hypothetical protein
MQQGKIETDAANDAELTRCSVVHNSSISLYLMETSSTAGIRNCGMGRTKALLAPLRKMTVFWDVRPCGLIDRYRCFGRT